METPHLTEAKEFLEDLQKAIDKKDKKNILELYEEYENNNIDWGDEDIIPRYIADELDELIEKANEIIY